MTIRRQLPQIGLCFALIFSSLFTSPLPAEDTNVLKSEVDELREENRLLKQQLQQQRQMIEDLNRKFTGLEKTNEMQENDVRDLKAAAAQNGEETEQKPKGFSLNNVAISGEGAVAFFETGKNGQYPNAAFRVDEAPYRLR
ncbi:MAG TPA: hypothetical protein VGN61_15090 [Verrucomicrobiae bacterium]|jgi:TolA-binding protein